MIKSDFNPMGYVPALDGLRGVAVVLVLLTHANFQLGDNGIIGVDIFFALSGFLITTLLLEEKLNRGTISLKAFYVRRFFRLFPPLYIMLGFVLLYALVIANFTNREIILKEVLTTALYVNNIVWVWDYSVNGLLLNHTWSLAVEEQFYLFWPIILTIGLLFKSPKPIVTLLLAVLLLLVTLKYFTKNYALINSLFHESIFIGCITALLRWYAKDKLQVSGILTFSLLALIVIIGVLPLKFYSQIHNEGGRLLVGFFTVLIVLSVVNNPNTWSAKILSIPPLVTIGKISYALYLWHVPVFKMFYLHSNLVPSLSFALKFVVSFLLAWLSWNLVENRSLKFGRRISNRLLTEN